MEQRAKDLMAMGDRLFNAKSSQDSLNQEIAEYFRPERADFTGDIEMGEEFASNLVDPFPAMVCRELSDQIGSMVRPSDRQWFKHTVEGKDVARHDGAKEYLEYMTEVSRAVLYSRDSGFRRAANEVEKDWSAFGMGWMQVSYSADRSNLMYRSHHLKNCAGEEGPDGQVDHVHRKCDMTARSMLHQFRDESKFPQAVKDALKEKDDKKTFKVQHCFVPLTKYEPGRKFPKWAKWADVYVTEDGAILQELPSATFDYIAPRWQTVSGKFYPFSPATIIALPQARMLQRMMGTIIEAGEKQVDPPLVAAADVIMGPVDITSGSITYIDSEYDERLGAGLRPLDLGKNVNLGERLVMDQRDLLSQAFFINKLAPLSNRDKEVTAYEASQLVQEYIRTALPLFEPIEDEWTGRVLDLTTEKIMRNGGFGQIDANGVPLNMPDELLGREIKYEFNNSLKEARDRQIITGYSESSQLIAAAAEMDPGVVSDVNTRDMFRDAFSVVPGGRSDWLHPKEVADKARQAQQEAAQQQQMMQQVQQGAQVATDVGNAAQALGALNG